MVIRKKDINKIFILFLFAHIIVWTLVPTLTNNNLPLDTIEALAWGSELKMGYQKHPPLSAWFLEFFYTIFKNQDWAYYFLSQLFVISSFIIIFKFSGYFFNEKIYSLLSVLILEGIYFYNFTTPEFNVNVCQLPFWSLTVYYCWKGIEKNDSIIWLIFGSVAALGVLSKYLFIYLIITRKFNSKVFISLISFFLILTPHIFWLINNDYSTINYAIFRSVNDPLSGFESTKFLNHIIYPLIFLGKQIGILIPFLIMLYFIVSRFKFKINYKDKKFLFLISVTVLPIMLVLITSLITGARIRTMGMTPFYLFSGVLIIYLFKNKINLKKLKNFLIIFLILFITSPSTYYFISSSKNNERTDYPGKKIAQTVENRWNDMFSNSIDLVGGDEWHGGNLSYHLSSRPKWDNILEKNNDFNSTKSIKGFVLIGEGDILNKICVGYFFEIEKQGVCMIGTKK